MDINIGDGPAFRLAGALMGKDVPFLFLTGYDQGVVPAEFAGVERLEKPIQLRKIVGAVANLLGVAP